MLADSTRMTTGHDRSGTRAALALIFSLLLAAAVLVLVTREPRDRLALFEWNTGNDPIVQGRSDKIEGRDPDDPFYDGSGGSSSLKLYRDCPMCAGTRAEHKYLRMLEHARSQLYSARRSEKSDFLSSGMQALALKGPKNVLNKVLARTSSEVQADALSYKSITEQQEKESALVRLLQKKKTELDSEVKEVQRDMERIAQRQEETVDTLKAR